MITCSACGSIYVECTTKAKGINVHTKIEEKGIVIVTPEYYQIRDNGKKPILACNCGKLDIVFACDFCGKIIRDNTANIVEDRHGKKLIGCKMCSGERPASSKVIKIKTEDFKFVAKS